MSWNQGLIERGYATPIVDSKCIVTPKNLDFYKLTGAGEVYKEFQNFPKLGISIITLVACHLSISPCWNKPGTKNSNPHYDTANTFPT